MGRLYFTLPETVCLPKKLLTVQINNAMTAPEPQPAAPKPELRWYQCSLRTLLSGMTVCALLCSWFAYREQMTKRQAEEARREFLECQRKYGGSSHSLEQRGSELRKYLLPPRGTAKEDVEKVFGSPARFASSRGMRWGPHYQYTLLPENYVSGEIFLLVAYKNGVAVEADIETNCFVENAFYPPEPSQYIEAIAIMEKVKAKFDRALSEARWNKKKEQPTP